MLFLWFLHALIVIVRFVLHCITVLFFRGKSRTVPPVRDPLLLKSATQLAKEIREGKVKSEDVIQAYIRRINKVDPYINATVDRCFSCAIKKAKEVDALIASEKFTKEQLSIDKPLLGVPFTVKTMFKVKGMQATAGSKLLQDVVATEDAPSIALMKDAGAIFLSTTNMPELGLNIHTTNSLYGSTLNPFDTRRTSGGSSGGESALIGAGGSLLGVGNDLLGSLRIPAHFTGVFAHKPSNGLVPNAGCCPALCPELNKYICAGPICRYAEDLIVSMQVLSSRSEIPLNLGKKVNFKNLKIYYLRKIQSPMLAKVDGEISTAINNAVSYFEQKYGVVAEEVEMPWLFDINRCAVTTLFPNIESIKTSLKEDKVNRINEKLDFLKFFVGKSEFPFVALFFMNFSHSAWLLFKKNKIPYYQSMVENWTNEFARLLNEETVLLLPTFPVIAPYPHEVFPLCFSLTYGFIFNLLGLPATHSQMGYNKEGIPYGVQLVSSINNDNLTIACAVELEKAFGGWKSPGTV